MEQATPPVKGAKRPTLMIVIIAAVVLAAGAGAGGYFYMHRAVEAAPAPPPEPGIVPLDPFLVNLADPGGRRFLKLSIRLVLVSKERAKAFEEDEIGRARVRSSIIELLAVQMSNDLVTAEGKAALKKAIAERAASALEHLEVSDVLFTDFVVQF